MSATASNKPAGTC